MKKAIIVLSCLFCLSKTYSQATLSFCAYVGEAGYCFFNNNQFISSPDSTTQRIFMQVKAERTFAGTSKVIFKIYSVAKNGAEKFEDSAEQDVKGDWIFAWVPELFKSPGQYKVKIYNDREQLLCEKGLQFFSPK